MTNQWDDARKIDNLFLSAMTQTYQFWLLLNAKSVHKEEKHGGSFKGCYQFPCSETNELIEAAAIRGEKG